MPTRNRTFQGNVSYSQEGLPAVEVSYLLGLRCFTEDKKRCETTFFHCVEGGSKYSESPQPPVVPDDLCLINLNEDHNWGLDELQMLESRSEDTKDAIHSLRV